MIELTENCFLLHTVCDISNHYIFIGKVSSKLFNYSINFVVITFDYLPIKKLKKHSSDLEINILWDIAIVQLSN